MLTRLAASQLRRPSGLLGQCVGAAMNRLNDQMTQTAIDMLAVRPDDRVLDAGFGGGRSLALLLDGIGSGQVHGVEISGTMLRRARRRLADRVASAHLVLTRASVANLPFPDGHFDAACTVNTLYFWPDAVAALGEFARVLRAGGRLALCYRPRYVMTSLAVTRHDFALYEPPEVNTLLANAGFDRVRQFSARDAHLGYTCALAYKRAARA